LVAVYGNDTVMIFLDGELESQTYYSDGIRYAIDPFVFGAYYVVMGSGYDFNGVIDEVGIYDVALSSQEVKALYEVMLEKDTKESPGFEIPVLVLAVFGIAAIAYRVKRN